MVKYEFISSPLPLPNPFPINNFISLLGTQTQTFSHLDSVPLVTKSIYSASKMSYEYILFPCPAQIWLMVVALDWSGASAPLPPIFSKYFPPRTMMMTHICSRTLNGSPLPNRTSPLRLDS